MISSVVVAGKRGPIIIFYGFCKGVREVYSGCYGAFKDGICWPERTTFKNDNFQVNSFSTFELIKR
jgi:hypothetical protein